MHNHSQTDRLVFVTNVHDVPGKRVKQPSRERLNVSGRSLESTQTFPDLPK